LTLLVGIVGLLGGVVDLLLQVAADRGRIFETAHPLVLGRAVGEERADLAGYDCSIGLDIVDSKVLCGVQTVETICVQHPHEINMLLRMVGLHRRCVDSHGAVSTRTDVDLLAFQQFSVGIRCRQLGTDRRLRLRNCEDGAAGVADADLPGDSRPGNDVTKVHGSWHTIVPTSFAR
jgi:hypothetical protein